MKGNKLVSKGIFYILGLLSVYLYLPVAAQQLPTALPASFDNLTGAYTYTPPGYSKTSSTKYALLIFLHGVGELAGDNATALTPSVLNNGVAMYIKNGKFPASFTVKGQTYSFIVVTPQFKKWPGHTDVYRLIDYYKSQYPNIDVNRIYVSGLSMGGAVTWWAISDTAPAAKQFAAAVVVCGADDPNQHLLKPAVIAANNLPVWAYHNDGDPVVDVSNSKNWVALINAANPPPNPKAQLTIFPNRPSHDAWTKAYDPNYKDPATGLNIYEWMLQYSKGGAPPVIPGGKRIAVTPNRGTAIYYDNAGSQLGVQPGDTLCIPAGDYDYIHFGNMEGTAAKPIVITNCGGLVRTGVNATTTVASFILSTCKYIRVEGNGAPNLEYGFDVNGTNAAGGKLYGLLFTNGSTDLDVHHLYVHDAGMFLQAKTLQSCAHPEYLEGAFVMRNVKIHHLLCRNSVWEGFYIGNTHYLWNDGTCTNLKSHHMENLEVYDNDLENMGSDGIQIAMADMGVNSVHHNRLVNYAIAKNSAHGYGILCGGGSALRIYNNRVDGGFNPGVQIFGSGVSYVYNNIISNIYYEGIDVADKLLFDPATAYIYNNTVYNTGTVGLKIYADLTMVGHKVFNNVIVAPGSAWDSPQSGYYIKGSNPIKLDFSGNVNFKTLSDGGFMNPGAGDLRLKKGSPAIDTGRDMHDLALLTDFEDKVRPQGIKYDAGAYEYVAGANIFPAANAGKDTVIAAPAAVISLDGSASTDADGNIISYSWKKVSGPLSYNIAAAGAAKTQVTGLVPGTYIFELTVTDDKSASATDRVTVQVQSGPNKIPVADAGADVTVTLPVSGAQLLGSNSVDPDGMITAYKWSRVSGPAAGVISITDASNTDVSGLVAGVYVFELLVTDNSGAVGKDSVTITVKGAVTNIPPVADAGKNIAIQLPVNTAALDGSASADQDGTIVTWLWKKTAGPAGGDIATPGAAKTNISNLVAGTYTYTLAVTDNNGASASATVNVVVSPAANIPPVAAAGNDISIQLPLNTAILDGTASTDQDGSIATWLWQKTAGPAGGDIATPGISKTNISNLVAGNYTYVLTVTDNKNASSKDTVKVLVSPASNIPPVAKAGQDLSVQLPANTTVLDGSASADQDGTIVTWLWKKTAGPAGGDIATPGSAKTNISSLVAGTYTYVLTVTDNNNAVSSDTINVQVIPAANIPPVAAAGADQQIQLPLKATVLDGSASADQDGTIVTWLWKKTAGPAGGDIATPGSAKTNISNLALGTYTYSLTVTDNNGASATATVKIVVVAAGNIPPVADAGKTLLFSYRLIQLRWMVPHLLIRMAASFPGSGKKLPDLPEALSLHLVPLKQILPDWWPVHTLLRFL